ncbi:hypothetical protein UB46_30330 [Burkholderiaceae bacterium 16]|nr:hypothetical protein UB46_30330 [Burkholderiaceae bacterium 16]
MPALGAVDALANLQRIAEAGGNPIQRVAGTMRVLGVELEMEPLVLMTQSRAVVLAIGTAGAGVMPAAERRGALVGTGLVAGRGRERGAASGVGSWACCLSRRRTVTGARGQPDGPQAPEAGTRSRHTGRSALSSVAASCLL